MQPKWTNGGNGASLFKARIVRKLRGLQNGWHNSRARSRSNRKYHHQLGQIAHLIRKYKMSFITPTVEAAPVGALTKVIDLSGGDDIVTAVEAILHTVYVNTDLNNFTVDIKDDDTVPVTQFVMPAKTKAGSVVAFDDAAMTDGITVSPDVSSTGSITVVYTEV